MSQLLDLYNHVGAEAYGRAIADIAPYFGTISPRFIALRPSYCELVIPHVRAVENHIGTVHAIALCNGAELAAGLMTDVSIPESFRWIPVGMSVRYLKKARGDLRVVADGANIDWSRAGETPVTVAIFDKEGSRVFDAEIRMALASKSD